VAAREPFAAVVSRRLSLLDWRRRVAATYTEARRTADPREGHASWRAARDELFATHPDSPLLAEARARFQGLPYAPYDPALRFEAALDGDVEPKRLEVRTGTDGTVVFQRFGRLLLPGLGSLDAWWLSAYGGGVFVPVKDALAGRETYGGGRYVLDTVKGADLGGEVGPDGSGCLVVDLNFAYNPSCAYDPAWACPLAQAGNVLAEPVRAGELYLPA
jgi:hypothetical protein